jgi:multicomponent Na+:H+ antiporter subunit E
MIEVLNILLRLVIWFLLTANLSPENIIIGIAVALLLPHSRTPLGALRDWLRVLWETIVAIPQAYVEAFELMFRPHKREEIVMERAKPRRSPRLIFLDIFLITFTPKTIVVKYHEEGWYEVHCVRRKQEP